MVKRYHLIALFLYALFYLGLFYQFPYHQAIPGNCDSWLVISLSNIYNNLIQSLFNNSNLGTVMYPATSPLYYGESAPLSAMIFVFFRLLGLGNIISYYFYISTIFILTAFGLYLVSEHFTKNKLASFFVGFAFTCNNFTFSNIDDSIVFFFFIPCINLILLSKYFVQKNHKYLIYTGILGGVQIYFSLYVYFFQTIILVIFSLYHMNQLHIKQNKKSWFIAIMSYLLIPIPFISIYLLSLLKLELFYPWDPMQIIKSCSLTLPDLTKSLSDNLIYSSPKSSDYAVHGVYWAYLRSHAFIGFLLMILTILSLFKLCKMKFIWITIATVGFILSFGPELSIGNKNIPMPLYYFYKTFPILTFFRIPSRTYFLFLFGVCFLAGLAIHKLLQNISKPIIKYLIITLIILIHFFENTSFPMLQYPIKQWESIPNEYLDFFSDKQNLVLLDLPSHAGLDFSNADQNLFTYNREIIYMNWQSQHKQNILGGVNGYYPKSRIDLHKIIQSKSQINFWNLMRQHKLDYIVYHPNLMLSKNDKSFEFILKSNNLIPVFKNGNITIFKVESFYPDSG